MVADANKFITGIVIIGITLIIGIFIAAEMADNMDDASAEQNAANNLVISLSSGTSWIAILVVVGFATIVLGMLSMGLGQAVEDPSYQVY